MVADDADPIGTRRQHAAESGRPGAAGQGERRAGAGDEVIEVQPPAHVGIGTAPTGTRPFSVTTPDTGCSVTVESRTSPVVGTVTASARTNVMGAASLISAGDRGDNAGIRLSPLRAICPARSTSLPPFRHDAAPPPGCSASRTGGRATTPPHTAARRTYGAGNRWFTVCSAIHSTLRLLCGFTCRQQTTTGESIGRDCSMFSPLVGGRGLV